MPETSFRAMIVEETPEGLFKRFIGTKTITDLPDGEVLIKVQYSSLNYKDALSATGNKGVTRKYPHTPGIDAAGAVAESSDARFRAGDEVLVTGYDLGMNTAGGFSQYIRIPADWVVPLPSGLSLKESMIYGTAGFTAALCVSKLQSAGLTPDSGEILVTGASGGVGSLAVALLSHNGFKVIAASGKANARDFLKSLGAAAFIGREELTGAKKGPLLPQRWAGAVDTVGGEILSTVIRSTQRHGAVACCGNAASGDLSLTVYPFILRGLSLMGADSATSTMETRRLLWGRLAGSWKIGQLQSLATEIGFSELDEYIDKILAAAVIGRIVVKIDV